MNNLLRENLLVAAEACFEQNPCPKIEKWCDDLSHTTKEETDNQCKSSSTALANSLRR